MGFLRKQRGLSKALLPRGCWPIPQPEFPGNLARWPQGGVLVLGAILLIIVLGLGSYAPSIQAQTPPTLAPLSPGKTLRVGTRVIPPFVMQEEYWGLSGFSIELWENLARELDLDSSFKVYPNVKDLLTAVEEKQMDVGIAAITINSERAQRVDFSYPIFSGGLQIMVRHPRLERSTWSFSKDLISSALPKLLALIVLIIAAMAHVVWLIERFHHDPIISSAYFPGIFQALWWTATGLVGQADTVPKGIPAKLIALFWMFASVGLVTYFTAAFTTALTVQQLQGSIQGLADLPGHTVATTAGSTAAKFLQGRKIKTLEWDRLEEVYAALMDREADAVVFDSGVLAYHANHDGKNLVKLVGEVFKPEDYAIAVAPGNPLGKEIDVALLKLKEDGTYDLLYDKYFKQE